jgi:hypothetical protein
MIYYIFTFQNHLYIKFKKKDLFKQRIHKISIHTYIFYLYLYQFLSIKLLVYNKYNNKHFYCFH